MKKRSPWAALALVFGALLFPGKARLTSSPPMSFTRQNVGGAEVLVGHQVFTGGAHAQNAIDTARQSLLAESDLVRVEWAQNGTVILLGCDRAGNARAQAAIRYLPAKAELTVGYPCLPPWSY